MTEPKPRQEIEVARLMQIARKRFIRRRGWPDERARAQAMRLIERLMFGPPRRPERFSIDRDGQMTMFG